MLKRKRPYFYKERRNPLPVILAVLVAIGVSAIWLYQYPAVQQRYGWRVDSVLTTLRTLIYPIKPLPTPDRAAATLPVINIPLVSSTPAKSVAVVKTAAPTQPPAPTIAPTPLPQKIKLATPTYERQDWNNCGPAALALYLRFYGWSGTQFDISNVIKPDRADRNVNIDELTGFVSNHVPTSRAIFRVGGTIDLLKRIMAAGMPVMIEETFYLDQNYWFNDDRWSGHYQVLTGYDDSTKTFIAQDSFVGPDRSVPYADTDKFWQSFNRAYIIVYPSDQENVVQDILGTDWDVNVNRQQALETAQQETSNDRSSLYAWFNLGSNLTFFERYAEAATAYDSAREIGLPQRMLRYQFGPFLAYFHAGRNDDLLALTEYALSVTPNSEEALLWRGWALYRANKRQEAINQINKSLEARPDYVDAKYALNYITSN
jgi:tetratricopeptide (TPR) repeat protein